ncbi:MAG: thioredoxin family protein [Alphaproteobacteria bacterium]|nr:thioredoxin family protein [Alphaproteobacteria bacterium]
MAASLALSGASPAAAAQGSQDPQSSLAASPWAEVEESKVRLVAAVTATGEEDSISLGLEFRMEPGWKTYWRSPGDAGLPPQVDWSGSANLAAAELFWPAPRRYSAYGLETVGYEKEVLLPVTARLQQPGRALSLNARVDYLTCKEICIPRRADLTLDLAAGAAAPTSFATLIARYAALVPGPHEGGELAVERVEALGAGDKTRLRITARSGTPFGDLDAFVEGPPGFWAGRAKLRSLAGGRVAVLTMAAGMGPASPQDDGKSPSLITMPLTVTLVESDADAKAGAPPVRALETRLTVTAGTETNGLGGFVGILAIALLGGLILNLMPCVLPVLSLKLLGVIGHGGGETGAVRRSFLATSAGILFTFMVLASLAVGLRMAGLSVGWGIQFQQPVFLAAMAVVLTLFACNLWGFFEIPLPGWMGDLALRHSGHSQTRPHSLEGQFLTGAFATLLATPCSAPFLGTAIGFALARGAFETYAVFAALGLGFAAPYLTMVAAPQLAVRLPRPGPWMVTLRRLLGLALALTALWLISVLAVQVSVDAAANVAVLLLVLGVVLRGLAGDKPRLLSLPRPWLRVVAGLLVLMALIAPGRYENATIPPPPSDHLWQPFDRAAIPALVASGRVVLVDVTAEWCLTCQVNKKLALDRGEVTQLLDAPSNQGGVIAMRADWTRRDDDIAAYLAGFGRFGIPFNVVYGPAAPQGMVLPELLTPARVVAAVNRAGGKTPPG